MEIKCATLSTSLNIGTCSDIPIPPNHGISFQITMNGDKVALIILAFNDEDQIGYHYIQEPDLLSLVDTGTLNDEEFIIGLCCFLALIAEAGISAEEVLSALNADNAMNYLHKIMDRENFMHRFVNDTAINFINHYLPRLKRKNFTRVKMESIEERTEIAIEEIDRKFNNCIIDIEDATAKLEETCRDLHKHSKEVKSQQEKLLKDFTSRLDDIVSQKVTEQISSIEKRLEQMNNRIDKLLQMLNYIH